MDNEASTFDFGVQNSLWPSFYGGYSNSCQMGITSTRSSPSLFYSGSSDCLSSSFPSIISGVLQVVNGDLGYNDFKGFGYSECTCTDVICDVCLSKQKFQQGWSNSHSPDYLMSQSTSTGTPSPPLRISHSSGSSIILCDRHPDAPNYYCQTCSKATCGECGLRNHSGHVTVYLTEAIECARMQTNEVLAETLSNIKSITDDRDRIAISATTLDLRAKQASEDVSTYTRRMVTAFEEREKKLLQEIEKARMDKMASLKAKDETLRNHTAVLKEKADQLKRGIEASKTSLNPMEFIVLKDIAVADIYRIRQARKSFSPPEENWISFSGPDNKALEAISNMGSIALNNPGPIGDRRALRGRGSSPPQSLSRTIPRMPIPRGRPIPGNHFPVVVWTQQHNRSLRMSHIQTFGNEGHASDNLCRPWGVACDKDGHIIVADRSNDQIQIYREDGSFVRKFGTHGSGPGQFDRPAGVAVDGRRRIIVADKDNHRIQILTMDGVFVRSFGEKGSNDGQFNYPWDVAVNSECQIVVSDTRNHRIQLFSSEGVFLRKFGNENSSSMWKTLDSPRGVSFTPEGNIAVTDFNNHRVVIIDADFTNSRILGGEGGGNKQFCRPQGIIVDDEGNIIVADSRNNRIQIFNNAGMFQRNVVFGTHYTGIDEMDRPSGIALTANGKIVVVDFGNNRVAIIS